MQYDRDDERTRRITDTGKFYSRVFSAINDI